MTVHVQLFLKVWWPPVSPDTSCGVRLLGATILASVGCLQAAAASKAEEAHAVMSQLAILGDPQLELLLLRSCAVVCKLVHVLLCTSPAVVDCGKAIFDESLLDSLRCIFVGGGGGFGPLQSELAALPMCMLGNPHRPGHAADCFCREPLRSPQQQQDSGRVGGTHSPCGCSFVLLIFGGAL